MLTSLTTYGRRWAYQAVAVVILNEEPTQKQRNVYFGKIITAEDSWKIIEAAKKWEGTPYKLIRANSVRLVVGDCSGKTNKSYIADGLVFLPIPIHRKFASYARMILRFRKIDPGQQILQAGGCRHVIWLFEFTYLS